MQATFDYRQADVWLGARMSLQRICPECSAHRKPAHRKLPCFGLKRLDHERIVYSCQNCGVGGIVSEGWGEPMVRRPPKVERIPLIDHDEERERRELRAQALWQSAIDPRGTPAETYWQARGLRLPLPPSIRYHPALRNGFGSCHGLVVAAGLTDPEGVSQARQIRGESSPTDPEGGPTDPEGGCDILADRDISVTVSDPPHGARATVAEMSRNAHLGLHFRADSGRLQPVLGVQRVFLASDGRSHVGKRSLGTIKGAPMVVHANPERELLCVCEGIEKARALGEAMGADAWASGGLSFLPHLAPVVPRHVEVMIAVDPGADAAAACERLSEALLDRGIRSALVQSWR